MCDTDKKLPLKIKQAVIVEGKYDKTKIMRIIDAPVIETNGFRIFKDAEKRALIRTFALKTGIIVLTDSDTAGFKIRNYIKSIAAGGEIIHIYIPQIFGKEKRKNYKSAEGYLGVEGMEFETLYNEFVRSGVSFKENMESAQNEKKITKTDFYEDGLSGRENSKEKRQELMKKLNIPGYLSTSALIDILNRVLSYGEYRKLLQKNDLTGG